MAQAPFSAGFGAGGAPNWSPEEDGLGPFKLGTAGKSFNDGHRGASSMKGEGVSLSSLLSVRAIQRLRTRWTCGEECCRQLLDGDGRGVGSAEGGPGGPGVFTQGLRDDSTLLEEIDLAEPGVSCLDWARAAQDPGAGAGTAALRGVAAAVEEEGVFVQPRWGVDVGPTGWVVVLFWNDSPFTTFLEFGFGVELDCPCGALLPRPPLLGTDCRTVRSGLNTDLFGDGAGSDWTAGDGGVATFTGIVFFGRFEADGKDSSFPAATGSFAPGVVVTTEMGVFSSSGAVPSPSCSDGTGDKVAALLPAVFPFWPFFLRLRGGRFFFSTSTFSFSV